MQRSILLLFLSWSTLSLIAQPQRTVVAISPGADGARWQSPSYEIPLNGVAPFLSYFLKWEGDPEELQIRFSVDGQQWSVWQDMPRDEHSQELPVSILGMTDSNQQFFQIQAGNSSGHAYRLECHFFSPGKSPEGQRPTTAGKGSGRSCSDLMPAYLVRTEWCPDGKCPENPSPAFADVTHLVIHHSAGSNQSNDWPAVVRSIWDFHVNGREWADIGYNWLVDPEGGIYEGRSNDAIGAHFCGFNTGTIGVCMLGDFTDVTPQEAALAALEKVLNWKVCENGIDPLAEVYHASSDKTLPTIIGHRDGCSTACPGNLFYPQLADIRADLGDNLTTGVFDTENQPSFQVFPNPTSGEFGILLPEGVPDELSLVLYDPLGRRVWGPVRVGPSSKGEVLRLGLPAGAAPGSYLLVLRRDAEVLGVRRVEAF